MAICGLVSLGSSAIKGAEFSPDGKSIAAGTSDGAVVIVSADRGKETARFTMRGTVSGLSRSPDGTWLAAGGTDDGSKSRDRTTIGQVRLWEVASDGTWNGKDLWVVRNGRRADGSEAKIFDTWQSSGTVMALASLSDVTKAEVTLERIPKGQLHHLRQLKHLRSLVLNSKAKLATDLSFLKEFDSLESLDIREVDLSESGLAVLAGLNRLEELKLGNDRTKDQDLANLGSLKSLKRLTLCGTALTANAMTHVAGIGRLVELDLQGTRMGVALPLDVGSLAKLSVLRLASVNDETLSNLTRLNGLSALEFNATNCTDDALIRLAGMPNVKSLSISNSSIPVNGIKFLASKGQMTHKQRREYYTKTRDTIASKLKKAGADLPNGQFVTDEATSAQLWRISRRIDFLEQLLEDEMTAPQPRFGGLLGPLYESSSRAGSFAKQEAIAEDIRQPREQRSAIAARAKKQLIPKQADLTDDEVQFGNAFGLVR